MDGLENSFRNAATNFFSLSLQLGSRRRLMSDGEAIGMYALSADVVVSRRQMCRRLVLSFLLIISRYVVYV